MMVIDKTDERDQNREVNDVLLERIGTEKRGQMLSELADYEMDRICTVLELPDTTIQVAKAIYRRSLSEKVVENTTISELCASSSYAAIRVESKPYSLSDVTNQSKSSKKEISKTFTALCSQLKLEVGPVSPQRYVSRFCEELGLSKDAEAKAIDIVEECIENGDHSGKSPSAFAASSVYIGSLLSDEPVTQKRMGNVADIHPRTIRNLYRKQIQTMAIALEISEDDEQSG